MARVHSSFLLRCWQVGGGGRRIEVEHIQSGERTVCADVAAAVDWICTHGELGAAHDDPASGVREREGSDGYQVT